MVSCGQGYAHCPERLLSMTKGFITIATGKDMYFQFAKNLLLSYKLYSKHPLPFAIMCDRENEYTALFDDVVVFEKTEHPYFDKFELLKLAPYDETIFIDSDCLAYADLNQFWDFFAGADAFSASGSSGVQAIRVRRVSASVRVSAKSFFIL